MPHDLRLAAAAATRRSRPMAPRCRGGASSMLRLALPVSPRGPGSAVQALSQSLGRAVQVLSLAAGTAR